MEKKMAEPAAKNEDKVIKSGSISAKDLSVECQMPVKPVSVRIKDLKENLNKVMDESGLPPFLSVIVLRELLMPFASIAEKEYEQDLEAWKKACEEWERVHKEGERDG